MNSTQSEHDYSIYGLIVYLWSQKILIGVFTLIFSLGTVVWTLTIPNTYRSEVLLSPADDAQGGLAGLGSQLGGIASLAGISLESEGVSKVVVAISVATSRQFAREFIDTQHMAIPLIAGKEWDAKAEILVIDEDIYDVSNQKWVRKVSPPFRTIPSDGELYEAYMDMLEIQQDVATGLITIALEHLSPELVAKWAQALVSEINATMRSREISRTSQNIDYLNKQVEQTQNAEVKTVFYELIQEQYKNLMLAEVRQDFVFEVIDPAIAPELKYAPKRALICLIAAFISFFIIVSGLMVFFLLKPNEHNAN